MSRATSRDERLRLRVADGRVVSDTGEFYDLREAIEQVPWVKAKMYPPPHEYVVFGRCPTLPWEVVSCAIAKDPDSYLAYFRGYQRPMRYLDFEGRRYWRTASRGAGGVTHMLNRCLFDDAEPPRRVDQGAVPIRDWVGPPWELNGSPWPDWYVKGPDGLYRYQADRDPFRRRSRAPVDRT
jgi:hypothetical protein